MDKLILVRKKRRAAEIIRLDSKAANIVAELVNQTGFSAQTIVSQMVMFCKDRVEIEEAEDTDE